MNGKQLLACCEFAAQACKQLLRVLITELITTYRSIHSVSLPLQVYQSSCMGPNPLSAAHLSLMHTFQDVVFDRSRDVFNDFGGVKAWKKLVEVITAARVPNPWKFSAQARSMRPP